MSSNSSCPKEKATQIKLNRDYDISNETDKIFVVANDGTIAGRHPSISTLLKKAKSLDEEYNNTNKKHSNQAKTKIKELVKHAQLTCDIVMLQFCKKETKKTFIEFNERMSSF